MFSYIFFVTVSNWFAFISKLWLKYTKRRRNRFACETFFMNFYYFSFDFETRNCATANSLIELNWCTDWNKLRVNNNDVDFDGEKKNMKLELLGKLRKHFFLLFSAHQQCWCWRSFVGVDWDVLRKISVISWYETTKDCRGGLLRTTKRSRNMENSCCPYKKPEQFTARSSTSGMKEKRDFLL